VSGGCIISGALVRASLLFSDVRVDERSLIDGSVILPHVDIGKGCQVSRAIVDEGCQIPDGMQIGIDREADARRFLVTESGVVLVTADMLRRLSPQGL
jgi:glucose-1-phosphate adenylyltransferase